MRAVTPEFIAYVDDDESREIVSKVVEKTWPGAVVQKGGAADAVATLMRGEQPQAMLIDFSKSQDPEADAKNLRDLAPGVVMIGLGTVNDVSIFRKLLSVGVVDYLVKPLNPETLQNALVTAAHSDAGEEKKTNVAELVVIMGSRGGVGASTLAANAAWLIAEEQRLMVALIDLDIHYGTTALSLDVEPSPGLREALKNPSRIDSLFVTSALVKATDRLYVMGSEEPIDDEIMPDPTAVSLLLAEMRNRFQVVIVDLPRDRIRLHDPIMKEATRIVIVSELSLAGIRDSVRIINKIKQSGVKTEIKIVANRLGSSTSQMSESDFERGVEGKIDVRIVDDPKIAIASNAGKPVVATSGGVMSSPPKSLSGLKELAHMIAGRAHKEDSKDKKIWSLLKKK